MPAQSFDPFGGFAEAEKISTLGGEQTCTVVLRDATSGAALIGEDGLNLTPGAEYELEYLYSTSGSADGVPDEVQIEVRQPGSSVAVGGTTWTISNPTTSGQTRTIHIDDDPLNTVAGSDRCGMLELYIRMIRTSIGTYDLDSRGNGADGNDTWARGMLRAPLTLESHSVSNVSIGGAEPSLFAYPDPIYVRTTLQERTYVVDSHVLRLRQSGSQVASEAEASPGPNLDFEQNGNFDRVDLEYAVEAVDLRLDLDDDIMSGNNGSFREYVWADSGHETGWVRNSDSELDYPSRFDADPTVSIANESLDLPGSTVFNRNEDQGGSFEVHNARNEAITPVGSDSVKVKRVADGTVEETATVSRSSGVVSWDVTFATSGNNAPADATGDAKILEWQDTDAGIDLLWPESSQIGFLSSLLNADSHLQNDDNALDPNLDDSQRRTDQLGFYSILITNQRDEGKNGVSVTDHLRDDADLVSQIDRTDTTQTVNGHDGYLPLKAWDSQLPGGGWDHWTDSGSFEGNTFELARGGSGVSNLSLVAPNNNLLGFIGGGNAEEPADHFIPGVDLLLGIAVLDTRTWVAQNIDSGTLEVILGRVNVTLGRREYLDPADLTWKSSAGATASVPFTESTSPALMISPGDSRLYTLTIPAATTADWDPEYDIFPSVRAEIAGSPIANFIQTTLEGISNMHAGYSVDSVGLGLHGILSQR